jgi:hypothetical protein
MALLLAGCTTYSHFSQDPPQKLLLFNEVSTLQLSGFSHVDLFVGSKENKAIIAGEFSSLPHVLFSRSGDRLSLGTSSRGVPLQATVYVTSLDQLTVSQVGYLQIHGLSASDCSLIARDSQNIILDGSTVWSSIDLANVENVSTQKAIGVHALHVSGGTQATLTMMPHQTMTVDLDHDANVTLEGYPSISEIHQTDTSVLTAQWLDSQATTLLTTGATKTQLAGKTGELTIHAEQSSRVNAQFVRAGTVEVKTKDQAKVNVNALNSLFAQASDISQIFYFGHPVNHYENPIGNAVILPGSA